MIENITDGSEVSVEPQTESKLVYLLADSQLLFSDDREFYFSELLSGLRERESATAAYIGASNDDEPAFYELFQAAMEGFGIRTCRMISASFQADDVEFIKSADVILLAGGDTEKGWRTFEKNGIAQWLIQRYYEGAFLMGVSAGAVQLGLYGWPEGRPTADTIFETLKLLPFIVHAHDEKQDWEALRMAIQLKGGLAKGIGIPMGGGAVYHADGSLEPLRYPLTEISSDGERLTSYLVFPTLRDDVLNTSEVC